MQAADIHFVSPKQLLLRIPEAAHILNISKSKLYSLVNQGTIPAIRVGESIRISVAELNAWIAEQPKVAT